MNTQAFTLGPSYQHKNKPFPTQQALTLNQMSAGRLTCGQLGANTCLSLDKALCASCIINNFGRLRGQELSCSQGAEPYHLICCPFLLSIIQVSLEKYQLLISRQAGWTWRP